MTITTAQRRAVIQRAGNCCEYCRVQPADELAPFHIDHIVPLKHKGSDETDNLSWSCFQCNSFKGSNIAAADPQTGEATFLYNPRTQIWDEHFQINDDASLTGKTPQGRTTIEVMRINEDARIQYRLFAMSIDEYPCNS